MATRSSTLFCQGVVAFCHFREYGKIAKIQLLRQCPTSKGPSSIAASRNFVLRLRWRNSSFLPQTDHLNRSVSHQLPVRFWSRLPPSISSTKSRSFSHAVNSTVDQRDMSTSTKQKAKRNNNNKVVRQAYRTYLFGGPVVPDASLSYNLR